jgi:drug/metabolite transporter (DMT)-like permease
VTAPQSLSSPAAMAGAAPAAPAIVRSTPPRWKLWSALWTVYIVWGSTYLGIRLTVETVPPLLSSGLRFTIAGGVLLAVLAARRGTASVRPARSQLVGALGVGLLLPGANAVVSVAEQEVPSSLAALLFASIPLWVILLRRAWGERIPRVSIAAVLVGFAAVGLLLNPGEESGGASLAGLLACVAGAAMWASGSFASRRVALPADPLVSTGWQMLLGGLVILVIGLIGGEAGDFRPSEFSLRSVLALAYLVVFGSWLAFTAYAWLLQNAPISKVATYAYVNPVVAIALGWLVLGETITPLALVAAAVIVATVALVVRSETPAEAQRAS